MTPRQKKYKDYLIKAIHIHKTYQDVYKDDRELWQEFLKNNFNVDSSKKLTISDLKSLLEFLDKGTLKKDSITKPQHDEIKVIWAINPRIRVKEFSALKEFIKKIVKKDVNYDLRELTKEEAKKIIIALKKMYKK